MAGPDFPKAVAEVLAARAAFRCSNPDCHILTVGPHSEDDKRLTIGEAAHIYGARESERRYRTNMTDAERASITNGIWLCRNCHGEIDKDPIRFPAELLFTWRFLHERQILEELGTAGDKIRQAVKEVSMNHFDHLPVFVREIVRNKADFWEHFLTAEVLDYYLSPILRRGLDLRRGIILRRMTPLSPADFTRYLARKPTEMLLVPSALEQLLQDLMRAWGAPGTPGDEQEIDRVCRLFADAAQYLVDIAEDTKFTEFPSEFEPVRQILLDGVLHTLSRFAELPAFLRKFVADAPREETIEFELIFDLPPNWAEHFSEAVDRGAQLVSAKGGW